MKNPILYNNKLLIMIIMFMIICLCGCEPPYRNPSINFDEFELVGEWISQYSKNRIDKLIILENGKYKQIYQENGKNQYYYESNWNQWWLEPFPDGRLLMHFNGGIFYELGEEYAKFNGMIPACDNCPWRGMSIPLPYYDPISKSSISMLDELILNVQLTSGGNVVLLHMLTSADNGFIILSEGFKAIGFRKE